MQRRTMADDSTSPPRIMPTFSQRPCRAMRWIWNSRAPAMTMRSITKHAALLNTLPMLGCMDTRTGLQDMHCATRCVGFRVACLVEQHPC